MSDLVPQYPPDLTSGTGDLTNEVLLKYKNEINAMYQHLTNIRKRYTGPTPPVSPNIGDPWRDISGAVAVNRVWTGTAWDSEGLGSGGMKNVIINGNFDIWQRGGSSTSIYSKTYAPDRWCGVNGSGQFSAISRYSFTGGQTEVPNNPKYYLRFSQTSSSGSPELHQYIESVYTFSSETVTLSFWAKADATRDIGIKLTQNFGTGGSGSLDVDTATQTVSVTNSWKKFTVTFTLASILGRWLGEDGNDCLQLKFILPANTTFTFDIAQVQLEKGSVATDFEQRHIAQELVLCQRYYEKSVATAYHFYYSNGSTYRMIIPFAVVKRVTPTITSTKGAFVNCQEANCFVNGYADCIWSGTTSDASGVTRFTFTWAADAEL